MKGIWLKPTRTCNDNCYEKEKSTYYLACQKSLLPLHTHLPPAKKTPPTHKKQTRNKTILFFETTGLKTESNWCEQLVQLLCQDTYKKYFQQCKDKRGYTTIIGMFLHCVTLEGEMHHSLRRQMC